MPDTFSLVVVTPERQVVEETVEELTAPGFLGEFGVLPQHTPFLCILGDGELAYGSGAAKKHLTIFSGYAEVGPEKVTVLAELAEAAEEIDVERAERAKQRAEERLTSKSSENIDPERARVAMMRALIRLQVAGRKMGL
jgi:F-type H+-transporting ATPase subunit epsilon